MKRGGVGWGKGGEWGGVGVGRPLCTLDYLIFFSSPALSQLGDIATCTVS